MIHQFANAQRLLDRPHRIEGLVECAGLLVLEQTGLGPSAFCQRHWPRVQADDRSGADKKLGTGIRSVQAVVDVPCLLGIHHA